MGMAVWVLHKSEVQFHQGVAEKSIAGIAAEPSQTSVQQ